MPSVASPHRAHAQQAARRHRLLADPTRLEVLLALSKAPQTVSGLASSLGVHVNTIRAHIDRLQAEGMVRQEKSLPAGRGRPARRFYISEDVIRHSELPGRDYRLLSEVLLGVLRSQTGQAIEAEAQRSGEAWGRHLASSSTPKPGSEPPPDAAVAIVQKVFLQMQFAPSVQKTKQGWDILLHNCPYKEVARENQDAICSFHHGVLQGILRVLGSDLEPQPLEPFIQPDICRAPLVSRPKKKRRRSS